MIEHLSAERISQWMIGERTPQLEKHVGMCAECRAELGQMEAALSKFRTAMRSTAISAPPPVWQQAPSRNRWYSWPRLVVATMALLILVALPITWRVRVQQRAAETALADSQLLERVDSAISQAVPQPMEPLVSLVAWNSGTADRSQKAQKE